MPRMALGVAYDGAQWGGWQTQPHNNTVQDALEAALGRFLSHPVATVCAGRTDAGVHALGQVVHLDTDVQRRDESWVRGLNALLPRSIAVQWARPVPDGFHARFSAQSRTYVYVLRTQRVRSPMEPGRMGWVYYELDLALMQQAARSLLGRHDFSSFRSSECQAASPVRHLERLDIQRYGDYFLFTFQANAFLHHMVRNLMGCLLLVGRGRKPVQWVSQVLAARDRRLAGATFSAQGLYLARVDYPAQFGIAMHGARDLLFGLTGMLADPGTDA